MDLARYLRERMSIGSSDEGQLLFEGFYSYLLPQFEGIDDATGDTLYKKLGLLMGSRSSRAAALHSECRSRPRASGT